MQTELSTRERLNRFEIAQETIGFMMAMRTEAIHDEEKKSAPDRRKIVQWNKEFERLSDELYNLRLSDDVTIQHVLDEYCPLVKAEYETFPRGRMTIESKLDSWRHEIIYTDKIATYYLPKSSPQKAPHAVITGGQPGSGKSGITSAVMDRFQETGYVLVDADKLRPYHPEYLRLMRHDDKTAANSTHGDCGPWAARLLRDAVEGRRNIIIDQTSRDSEGLTKLAQGLKQAGYTVELHVMAVSSSTSEQRIYQRYEGQRAKDGFGRFSTKDKHDEAYAGVSKAVASVEE